MLKRLDFTDDEADQIRLTLDPLPSLAMAGSDAVKLLLASVHTESDAVKALLEGVGKTTGVAAGAAPRPAGAA